MRGELYSIEYREKEGETQKMVSKNRSGGVAVRERKSALTNIADRIMDFSEGFADRGRWTRVY
jgi:hypothetical protein